MRRHRTATATLALVAVLPAVVALSVSDPATAPSLASVGARAAGGVDEVTYAYGDSRSAVVVSWRGAESTLHYGLDDSYGHQATATVSAITPVDLAGPFMEARLTGLEPGTRYHYRIGTGGPTGVFTTAAANHQSFTAVALGDTMASSCHPRQHRVYDLVAARRPDFVIHHGDLSIANECGNAAVHRLFLDLEQSFSRRAAFLPVWGNHEYGKPRGDPPAGTTRDTLANYKGRVAVPHAQMVAIDTVRRTGHPGCGQEIGSPTNTCRGEDWGWFRAGRVVFISVPEPWPGAISEWATTAASIMGRARRDPTVDFVVTYGHRPLLSSTDYTPPAGYRAAFGALAAAYGPSAAHPSGKYVLALAGHRHNVEVFGDRAGPLHVVNGGGGQGLIRFRRIVKGSTFRMKHLGFSSLRYNARARELTFRVVCGPRVPAESYRCTPGSVVYRHTFRRR